MNKTILFDLDGTIIDSCQSVLWGIEQSLNKLGIPIPHELYVEKETNKLFAIIKKILPQEVTLGDFKDVYDNIIASSPTDKIFVLNEVKDFLTQLRLSGYRLVVLQIKENL